MSRSTVLLTPPPSTSSVPIPGLASVKIEPSDHLVHILSDSDDDTHSEIKLGDTVSNPFQNRGSQESSRPSRQSSHSIMFASLSTGRSSIHPAFKKNRSIRFAIRMTASRKGSLSELSHIDFDSIEHEQVKYLTLVYGGEKIFELPRLREGVPTPFEGGIDGMSKQYDGHVW